MADRASSMQRALVIAAAVGALGLLVLWLRFEPAPMSPSEPLAPAVPGPAEAGAGGEESPALRRVSPRAGAVVLQSSEVVEVAREDLAGDAPLEIELVLPEGVSAKRGRLVTPDAIAWPLDAQVAGQTGSVAFTLPVDRIRSPGRYLFEVRTDERSAVPLRRYAIEAR